MHTTVTQTVGHSQIGHLVKEYLHEVSPRAVGYQSISASALNSLSTPITASSAIAKRAMAAFYSLDALPLLSCGDLIDAIGLMIKLAPYRLDMAYDVDGAGYTRGDATPVFSTGWVKAGRGCRVRFSQSRIAMHTSGALRTPIEGGGIAVEVTRFPHGGALDTATMFVLMPQRHEDLLHPHVQPRDGAVFDLRTLTEAPLSAGPLYNGYPSVFRVPDEQLSSIQPALIEVLTAIRLGKVS